MTMATLFLDGQKPTQKALQIIVDYFCRKAHPIYLGYVSMEVGWSLARTKEMLDILEDDGVVKQLSNAEKACMGIPSTAIMYVLCDDKTKRPDIVR